MSGCCLGWYVGTVDGDSYPCRTGRDRNNSSTFGQDAINTDTVLG